MKDIPNILHNKLLKEPSDLNLNAFLGAYSSIMNINKQNGEKDFRNYEDMKGKLGDFII